MKITAKHIWEEIKMYFQYCRGSSFVTFKEVSTDRDGKNMLYTDGFSIYICKHGECKTHFGTIEWEDVGLIIETLETAKKHVEIEVETGTASSKIFIPKREKKNIIKELKERKFRRWSE